MRRLPIITLLLALLGGCGPAAGEPGTATAAERSATASATASATLVRLDVQGGPTAGHYEVTSNDVTCSQGILGSRTWGVQYTNGWSPDGITSLQLIIADTGLRDGRTGALHFGVAFGRLLDESDFEIETRPGAPLRRGRATVMVHDSGGRGSFTISGRTADSVDVAATIRCGQVRRMGAAALAY